MTLQIQSAPKPILDPKDELIGSLTRALKDMRTIFERMNVIIPELNALITKGEMEVA